MAGTCAFCGFTGKLTGEHVFGDWLSKIGLDLSPTPHQGGPLNRIGRDLGLMPPFRTKVKDVCGPCNNGWMSNLEDVAKRILTPFILGKSGVIQPADLGAIAAWVQKTALVTMLVSSEEDRAGGYGLPPSEYQNLSSIRDDIVPLPASRFWIGRYEPGLRSASTWVTPFIVDVDGYRDAEVPHGYLMTVIVGQLLLHGVQFTTPVLEVSVATNLGLPVLWPSPEPVEWPRGSALTDAGFFRFADGRDLQVCEPGATLRRWTPATDLPDSRVVGSMVELPLACGKHVGYYPARLAVEALRGRVSAFITWCECPKAYLVQTESDGVHFKAEGPLEAIQTSYEALPGEEDLMEVPDGRFFCKHLRPS